MADRRLAIYAAEATDEPLWTGAWPEAEDPVTVAQRLGRERAWARGLYVVALVVDHAPRAWRTVTLDLPPPAPDPWRPIELAAELFRAARGRP